MLHKYVDNSRNKAVGNLENLLDSEALKRKSSKALDKSKRKSRGNLLLTSNNTCTFKTIAERPVITIQSYIRVNKTFYVLHGIISDKLLFINIYK